MIRGSTLLLFFCAIAFFKTGYAQDITFPINIHDGQVIETCSGLFTDSGGDTLAPYGNNENFSVTFTSDSDENIYIKMSFIFFQLGEGDYLYVYDGEDETAPLIIQAGGNELAGGEIFSTGSSLHFRFESSPGETGLGWLARIECFSLCDAFYASVVTDTDSFDFCPDVETVTFFGSAGYFGGDPAGDGDQYLYEWYFDGEVKEGQTVDHTYNESGAYPFRLTVTDPVNNCVADTLETVRIATIPNFNNTIATADTVCAEEPFSLIGSINPVTWTGFLTTIDTVAFINDTVQFTSTLNFDVFEDDAQLTQLEDFGRVCINIEHVDFGHLMFELECSNEQKVLLKDIGPGGAHLGEPVVPHDDIPGIGYEYCFNTTPQYGTMDETSFQFHEYLDQAGNYYVNQPYMPPGNYTPDQSFDALVGCPLNGEWSLTVSDIITGTSGHVMGWSLFFDDKFYPDSLIFTPEIVEEQWFDMNDTPLEGNPVSVSEDEEGDYTYIFRAMDNFGCEWDTIINVTVLPLPRAEIVSDLEIPVCEGDSTLLTVEPVNFGDELNWIYQWMLEGAELEGRIYDTIMAKEPATYMLRVTDTITGCSDFFDLALTTQNCDLEIPNVFTPNGDGINDNFEITNLEFYPGSNIVIYNRNGKKVFESNDYYGNWWDGGNHPDGTYYYVLTYVKQGERKQTQGIITIVR
ncbi:MAG: gliding motility-associated C-terminal domain-containing protein [Bacteroidales bacterium]